jgi:octaprenyl-diphosphate synthase
MTSPSEERAVQKIDESMSMEEVFLYVKEDLDRVEETLIKSLRSDVLLISEVGRYIFKSGGKRMRPLLTILSSRLCGYEGDAHISLAAVMELIHTATLLHDDVVDHAEMRRGERSVNRLWNSETSILIGDFLFTRSFCMMVEHQDLKILDFMSETCKRLAEGEILELAKSADPAVKEQDYLSIIRDKTAVLISASCRVGAILGHRPQWEEALASFGLNLGLAFQLVDDLLDFEAEEDQLGKTIGKDLQEGKVTLPLIRTLQMCTDEEREELCRLIKLRSQDPLHLHSVQAIIKRYDGLEYCESMARRYIEEAKGFLDPIPSSRPKTALLSVADFIVQRRH